MDIPKAPTIHTGRYENLKGVDFSYHSVEVDRQHSPDMLNMIADEGGNPVKRVGWRVEHRVGGRIIDMFFDSNNKYVAYNGGIWDINANSYVYPYRINDCKMIAFNGDVYAFGLGNGIYNITKGENVNPYVPEVIISRNANGTGGTFLESANLLTPKKAVSFYDDNTSKTFQIYTNKEIEDKICPYIIKSSIKVEVMNSNGVFEEYTTFTTEPTEEVTGFDRNGNAQTYTVCKPKITLLETHTPPVKGQDNVKITYESFDMSQITLGDTTAYKGLYVKEYSELLNSTIIKTFGYENADRLFICVGGKRVYYSDVNKASYFPDDNYVQVTQRMNIVGLHRYDECLLAITEDTEVESTVHLIYGALNSENKTYFAVRQALGGVGALTPKTFATLLDEPLFLGLSGVYGITNNSLVSSKIVRRRSRQVDRQLLQERDLKDAVATVWNDYYILCVNSHCYVLDGRQKVTDRDSTTNFNYEAYYWTNVPACAFETLQDELWFGTTDGRICKFNTDIDNTTKYRDGGTLSDGTITGGESIHARWSTPLDDDGYTQYFKTLNKKGTVVSFKPCEKMSADLYYVKDGKTKVYMGSLVISDGIDFTDIDFTNFVFGAEDELNELYPNRKVKKYKKLQFILENNKVDESLGIINLVKSFTVNGFVK